MTQHEAADAPTGTKFEATRQTVVYFDGVCGMCNRFVDFLLRHDRKNRFCFAPLQGETARQNLPNELIENLKTVAFVEKDQTWTHSAAIIRILWRLAPFWRILGCLLWLIPSPLRDAGYRVIAARRYRFFGRRETCRMPTEAERDRLLP